MVHLCSLTNNIPQLYILMFSLQSYDNIYSSTEMNTFAVQMGLEIIAPGIKARAGAKLHHIGIGECQGRYRYWYIARCVFVDSPENRNVVQWLGEKTRTETSLEVPDIRHLQVSLAAPPPCRGAHCGYLYSIIMSKGSTHRFDLKFTVS